MQADGREPADWGLDAPTVVRNLLVVGVACLAIWASAAVGWWSGVIDLSPSSSPNRIRISLAASALWTGIGCSAMGLWMVWSSKIGKVRERDKLLRLVEWRGDERVLDVGCGRGLLLIGAAQRLDRGSATGIDLWQAEDLSGNRLEATLENARREGVSERIEVKTADMREIPFADATFDVVVSRAAIHNLYAAADRARAIAEIARVLKPGGRALIDDIRHEREYVAAFARNGCALVRRVGSRAAALLLALITFGSLRPMTLLLRKAA